jgi:dTDP-4-amino-4,6-dideoxygalactose transaminase
MLAQGRRVAEFERAFADYIGVKHAVATSSGTTALNVALLAHGVGPGDEVITTPFTFIASATSILSVGARPTFVDIDASYNINPALIEAAITPHTKAILPVHLYGQPANLEVLGEIARRHQLVLIEDACQAHGAMFMGKKVGSFGTGCFSFYATKNMTTGEGGMITTNDDTVAERARLLINHGMRIRYHHDQLGFNFRMTDMSAAIGIEQLKKLPGLNARRADTAAFYTERLKQIPGLIPPSVEPSCTPVWHQYTVRVRPEFALSRDRIIEALRDANIGAGIYYPIPVHRQQALQHVIAKPAGFPWADQFAEEVFSIPVHPGVSLEQRDYIASTLEALAP